MMNLQQNPRRQWKRAASLCHKPGQLRHHERDENCDEHCAGQSEKCRINQGLLHAISQVFCLHQMLDQPKQNLRQRSARLARSHEIYLERLENSWPPTRGLRKTAAIDQALVRRMRHLLNARLLQTLLRNRPGIGVENNTKPQIANWNLASLG